jgi:hypothetical protein
VPWSIFGYELPEFTLAKTQINGSYTDVFRLNYIAHGWLQIKDAG